MIRKADHAGIFQVESILMRDIPKEQSGQRIPRRKDIATYPIQTPKPSLAAQNALPRKHCVFVVSLCS